MCPSGKHQYLSWQQAKGGRHGLRRGRNAGTEPYHCDECGYTHLGKLEHEKRLKMTPYRRRKRVAVRARLRRAAA